eukprot:Gb_10994 [translate_table: standard]
MNYLDSNQNPASSSHLSGMWVIVQAVLQTIIEQWELKMVLSDDEKRSLYDQFGEAGVKGDSTSSTAGVNPFDLFESFFSGSNDMFGGLGDMGGTSFKVQNSRRQQGDDIR